MFGRLGLRFPYLARPLAEEAYKRLTSRPGWAGTQLEVMNGVRLNGLIRRPTVPDACWILFYPGNDESQLERGQTYLARLAEDTDFGLAVFAYRGYDSSGGKTAASEMAEDAPEILLRLCAAEGARPELVHVVGFSIGGFFATRAAAGVALLGRRARTLTLLASVNDVVMVHPSPWQRLDPGERYRTTPSLVNVPAPVLVLQGTADSAFRGPGEGRAIAAVLGDRAAYHELPGVDHVPLLFDERSLALVREFLRARSSSAARVGRGQ